MGAVERCVCCERCAGPMRLSGYRALLQNIVSCIGLFCIKDLQAVKDETPYASGVFVAEDLAGHSTWWLWQRLLLCGGWGGFVFDAVHL